MTSGCGPSCPDQDPAVDLASFCAESSACQLSPGVQIEPGDSLEDLGFFRVGAGASFTVDVTSIRDQIANRPFLLLSLTVQAGQLSFDGKPATCSAATGESTCDVPPGVGVIAFTSPMAISISLGLATDAPTTMMCAP